MVALQGKMQKPRMWNGQIWVNQTKHLKHQSYWWFSWPHWCASIFNTTVDESWWGFSREALVKDDWFGGTLTLPLPRVLQDPFSQVVEHLSGKSWVSQYALCSAHMQHSQTNPLVVYLTKPLVNRYWNYNPLIWTLEWPLCLTIGQFDNLISNLTFSWSQNLLPLEWPLSGIW